MVLGRVVGSGQIAASIADVDVRIADVQASNDKIVFDGVCRQDKPLASCTSSWPCLKYMSSST